MPVLYQYWNGNGSQFRQWLPLITVTASYPNLFLSTPDAIVISLFSSRILFISTCNIQYSLTLLQFPRGELSALRIIQWPANHNISNECLTWTHFNLSDLKCCSYRSQFWHICLTLGFKPGYPIHNYRLIITQPLWWSDLWDQLNLNFWHSISAGV